MSSETELAKRRGSVDSAIEQHDEQLADHDDRIGELEKFKERTKGAVTVLSIMAGTGIVGVVAELVGVI